MIPTAAQPSQSRRHLSGSILSVGGSRSLSLVVVAITSIAITRILGPAGLGTYAIASSLLLVFTVIFELGLPQAVAYYAGRNEWNGMPLARGAIAACVALSLPGAIVALICFALFGDSVPGMTWPMAIALSLALPAALLWRTAPQAALAQERFETFALLDSAPALLACPISIAAAALTDTEGAVIGFAAAMALSGVAIGAWLLAGPGGSGQSVSPPGGARAVLGFGLPAWIAELLTQVNLRASLVLVGAYAGASESGLYSVGLSTAAISWMLLGAFAVSALPRSARLQAHSEQDEGAAEDRDIGDARTIRHAVLAIPPVAVGGVLLIVVGIPLFYGHEFAASVELGLLLMPGSLLLGVGMAAVSILLARGRSRQALARCLAVVPTTVVVYTLTIPSGGSTSAAIVCSVSYAAFAVLMLAALRSVSGLGARDLLLPRRSDLEDYRVLLSGTVARLRRLPA